MNRPPAKRSLGQNFLVDRRTVARIVDAVPRDAGDAILEIGPGDGALTDALLRRGDALTAVELDRRMAERLRSRFRGAPFRLLEEDILTVDLGRLCGDGGKLTVVGNLPYNISKPIAMHLVRHRVHVAGAVLMFQREVALRLTALAGSRDYGPLTVLVGSCFAVERLFAVPPTAFRPQPKVVSSVTRWTPLDPGLSPADEPALRRCLSVCFARRRQTLRNNLRAALGDGATDRLLGELTIDGGIRAERLAPDTLRRMARRWPEPRL